MGHKDFFSGKRVTLMGLGLLGRGVGDAEFLAPLCKELVITDRKTEEELASSLARLKKFSNIRYTLGGHDEKDFTDTDLVIKAAGVPLDSPYIAAAHAAGVPVYMSTALFAKFAAEAGATIVGITGTRGKSTTTHLIYHALASAGKPVVLGGNVRGLSTLALLPEIKKRDTVVLELDSWQLQGFGDLALSPHVAVFTNLLADHLNYYQGNEDAYFWDKANIFTHQKPGDKLIAGAQVLSKIQKANPPVAPVVPPPLPDDLKLQLIGGHNKENAALAALALRMLGLSEGEIKNGLESFKPVEGRLQKIAEINGVSIYNDNNATTPDATIAALKSFDSKLILIAGGADKGLELGALEEAITAHCKKILLLEGTGTDRLRAHLPNAMIYHSIADAVKDAFAAASGGDTLLFSPAFASFGLFKNEYDRNDQFVEAVKKLQ
jgi:UDP-N-acetylmuramoylalanine--D-glutamate ligase